MGPSGRSYDDADRALALQLGRRAGLAVDNARLYDAQHAIADTLQRSLLPPALPELPGLEVAARYSPMGDGWRWAATSTTSSPPDARGWP